MGVVWVSGNTQYFSIDVFEVLDRVWKRDQFRWANIREIEWVEEEDNVFSFEIA